MLTKELQTQIEQEAEAATIKMPENNDYQAGIIKGYQEGYEAAGEKYAALMEQAEARAERAEKALREICGQGGQLIPAKHDMITIAREALTPKTGSDE